jgi:hypothetical protein
MWDPKTFVSRQEGYIYVSYGHAYVMRENLTARKEQEAQDSIVSRQWSGDSSLYYPLTRVLAQRADFPRVPPRSIITINSYNCLILSLSTMTIKDVY